MREAGSTADGASTHHRWVAVRTVVACVLSLVLANVARADGGSPNALPSVPIGPMITLTVVWVFAVAACVGSFLNVVVYRLPLGMRLSSPGSRCPACETPIERRDNVPVFGWLWLRGRCRACSAPISARYPLVEAATGLLVVGLLFAELSSGGANLPVRTPNAVRGLVWNLWGLQWDLIGLFAYHGLLVFVLVAAGLIGFDGQSTRHLLRPGLLLGLLPPLLWPHLYPVPFVVPVPEWTTSLWIGATWNEGWFGHGEHHLGVWLVGALDGLLGVVSGLVLGGLFSLGVRRDDVERGNVMVASTIVGGFLGWQTVWSVGWLAAIGWIVICVAALVRPLRIAPSVLVCLAALAQVFAWRMLFELDWWPNERGLPALGAMGWALVPALPVVAVFVARAARSSGPPAPEAGDD